MKKSKLQFAFVTLALLLTNCNRPLENCTITGRVIGRSSSSLILINALERPDPHRAIANIPIKDSIFTFELDANPVQAYWLIFEDDYTSRKGLFPITIFPDKEEIKLELYDSKLIAQNKIYGGKLNNQFASFREKSKSKYDPLLNALYEKLNDLGENVSIETAREINKQLDSIYKEKYSWNYNYYDQNKTLVSYYLLLDELSNGYNTGYNENYSDLSKIKYLINSISAKYPDHPYNNFSTDLIAGYDKVKVGGEFVDFTLPDLNGDNVTMSQSIEGKIALIDFWASWCGPCIVNSRSMIPVYNEFKDSGFTIIGVAGEIDNTNQLIKTLEREKFPWINLVELNKQNGIWTKYGIPNDAGCTFLVDKDGTILAVSPTAEEVRKILIQKF